MEIVQLRDITVISFDNDKYLGIACDSCGGIGLKEYDLVKASPKITAYQTGKVVTAELMALGFMPLVFSNGLAVEMEPTGKQLIEGFNEVLSKLKSSKVHLTGSTEENIKTFQTSMGVTCIGICDKDKIRYKKTSTKDICLVLGSPLVGYEVLNNPDKVLDIEDFEKLYLSEFVKEILPVGSRGIRAELNDLCAYNNLGFEYMEDILSNLDVSGGPSTCCLVTLDESNIDNVYSLVDKPKEILGKFI